MSKSATNECNSLIGRLYRLALEFREGIERCDRRHFHESMLTFPKGACYYATCLLGTYLKDSGIGRSIHASGYWADEEWFGERTHSWLELQGAVVDITADQYSGIPEPVIVRSHSPWHAALVVYLRREATYRTTVDFVDGRVSNPLDSMYWEIVRTIDPNHDLLERREQLTVHKTLTPQIDEWAPLRPAESSGKS